MDHRIRRRHDELRPPAFAPIRGVHRLAHGAEITQRRGLDPSRDELFTAIQGRGAQLNDAALRPSAGTRLSDALSAPVDLTSSRSRRALSADLQPPPRTRRSAPAGACGVRHGLCLPRDASTGSRDDLRAGRSAAGARFVTKRRPFGDFAGGPDTCGAEVIAAAPGIFNPLRRGDQRPSIAVDSAATWLAGNRP